MIIQQLCSLAGVTNDRAIQTAKVLDWVVAIALTVIGALIASGVITASPAVAYSMIGAGAVYLIMMLLNSPITCKFNVQVKNT